MALSPHDPDVLFYGSQYLHRTRDKGVTWEKMSPDLTANPECCQGVSGEPITRDVTGEEFYSTLYAISESPLERGVIWTGANDGPFYVTRDDGRTWTNVTPKDMEPGGRVQFIEASRHRKGSAYYAAYRYLLGDYRPYIYKTDNYGRTWKRLTDGTNGIPADSPTRVVREDPNREGLLYAGTEFGVYISFDDGAGWQPFQLNLPNVPVTDIRVHRKDLVVSMQGRGFWILDNITSLHQLTPKTTTTQVRLLRPRDGYRTRVAPGGPGPHLEDYLPSAPPGPVTIEILDASGALVNTYSSDATVPRGRGGRGAAARSESDDPETVGSGSGRGNDGPLITRLAGMNRFVWDVRHQTGLAAPPGAYQARLKVGDALLTQSFNLLIDPNVAADGVTAADLREQFDHNMRVRQLVSDVNALVVRVREGQGRLRRADAAKLREIDAIAGQLLTEPVRYGKPGLQAHITYLAGMTTGADQKIGRDAGDRYNTLKKDLDAIRAAVDRILK